MSALSAEAISEAHRHFAVTCFNRCWELIAKPHRTPAEGREMLRLTLTSHWHWRQREDYGPVQASVANWQVARVFALLGQGENARYHAEEALAALKDDEHPFYAGYAHEALARAAQTLGESEAVQYHLSRARDLADAVGEPQSRALLLADLDTIGAD